MSEIKGQILGIILTIGVFSIVFAALTGAFNRTAGLVEEKMTTALNTSVEEFEEDPNEENPGEENQEGTGNKGYTSDDYHPEVPVRD